MSLPKEPRQLMINLMYLVLTALLAMNVSREVINAFDIVDNSIVASNNNIDNKNLATIESFKAALEDEELVNEDKRKKIETAKDLAEQARAMTKTVLADLDRYRKAIYDQSGGTDATGNLKRKSDLEVPTRYMVEEGNGKQMKNKLNAFKTNLAALVDNGLPEAMKLGTGSIKPRLPLNLDDDASTEKPWEYEMFNMVPSIAAITIIDKYKNDVKNSETAALDELWASAMGERRVKSLVFKKYGIIATANNHYVLPGQKVEISAMLGAYNDGAQGLRISIAGENRTDVDGVATYSLTASGSGEKTVTVSGSYLDVNTGDWVPVDKQEVKYYVGQPKATISLDKMKVLYYGLENPLSVSASGVPLSNLKVTSSSNITLVDKRNGSFHALPKANNGEGWISITGTRSDGGTESFGGRSTYRLKRVPDPLAEVGGQRGGAKLSANAMSVQQGIFAKLRGFPYDIEYKVVSFSLFHKPKRGESPAPAVGQGNFLNHPKATPAVRAIMGNLGVGDRLFFENIKVVGPDKEIRSINGLSFRFTK